MANQTASKGKIEQIKEEVLASLDIQAEYAAIGLKFPTGARVRESGWIQAYAMGREDKSPSAAINVNTGCYKDSGSVGRTLSFWDAQAEFGPHLSWFDALKHYADAAKIKLPKQHKETALDQVEICGHLNPMNTKFFLRANPQFRLEDLQRAGCRLARYPKKSPSPFYCIAFPFYGPQLTDSPHRGWVLQADDGRPLQDGRGEERKRLAVGVNSGLSNWQALHNITSGKAKIVIKVEGYSDMLSLMSILPPDKQDSIAIVTNACGAHETALLTEIAPVFAGLHVIIVHDADEPGQSGAEKWVAAAKPHAKSVRNVQLFEEIQPKKGKDVSDWIAEGGTWEQFDALVQQSAPIEEQKKVETPAEIICKRLGITVYGICDKDSGRVLLFDGKRRRRTVTVNKFTELDLRQIVDADTIAREMNLGSDEPTPGRVNLKQVAAAIAELSFERHISNQSFFGDGIWKKSDNELVLVQSGEVHKWNGKRELEHADFCQGDQVYDVGSEKKWFNAEKLSKYIEQSKRNPQFDIETLDMTTELFSRWDNWKHPDSPELLAALICCTYLQTVLPIRPLVAISGQSNTGKSYFCEAFKGIFGLELAKTTTDCTEAALRNMIGNTSRAVYLDEFEEGKNRDATLNLLRTATRGDKIIRSNPSQQVIEIGLRHIVWASAKELGLTEAADANRFIQFELLPLPPGRASTLEIPLVEELRDLGHRILVASLNHWKAAVKFAKDLRKVSHGAYDRRLSEIYAVPIGMIAAIRGETIDEAAGRVKNSLEQRLSSTFIEHDEEILLDDIINFDAKTENNKTRTIGKMIYDIVYPEKTSGFDQEADKEALDRYGIKVNVEAVQSRSTVFMVPKIINKKILTKSQGRRDIKSILLRVNGAEYMKTRLMSGSRPWGVTIPIAEIIDVSSDDELSVF